ncbi:unnamed protein product [Thelazia callipaeda]|uniref:DOMON domain-containing protein n=1 Tax=Thelazia callipaeda TaxID=103827 RepID=A0A0N5DC60_THECL|nr:unnamed protein product [Thelazia callipaeda]
MEACIIKRLLTLDKKEIITFGSEQIYDYFLAQCSISFGDNYSLQWYVIGKQIYFQLNLSNIPSEEDFWIGIGFSKVQVNSPVDESEVVAVLRLLGMVTLEKFQVKNRKMLSAHSISEENDQTLRTYISNDTTFINANFSRPLHSDSTFDYDISNCAIWTFYTEPVLMNESFVDPIFDALICNVSVLCAKDSLHNFSHILNDVNRIRRQVTPLNPSQQMNQTSNRNLPGLYNPVINPQSTNYTAVLQQNQEALEQYKDISTLLSKNYLYYIYYYQLKQLFETIEINSVVTNFNFSDPSCKLPDPYWCERYVKQYLYWQETYNHLSLRVFCFSTEII